MTSHRTTASLKLFTASLLGILLLSACATEGGEGSASGVKTCSYSGGSAFAPETTLTDEEFVACVKAWGDAGFPSPSQEPDLFAGFTDDYELDYLKDMVHTGSSSWEVNATVTHIDSGPRELYIAFRDENGKCSDTYFTVQVSTSDGSIVNLSQSFLSGRSNPEAICA